MTTIPPSAAQAFLDGPEAVRANLPPIKIRKIPHHTSKFFGWPNEKWARGGGKYGYARGYGHYSHYQCDGRSRAEMMNTIDREELTRLAPDGFEILRRTPNPLA